MFEAYYSQLNTPCLVVDEPMTREISSGCSRWPTRMAARCAAHQNAQDAVFCKAAAAAGRARHYELQGVRGRGHGRRRAARHFHRLPAGGRGKAAPRVRAGTARRPADPGCGQHCAGHAAGRRRPRHHDVVLEVRIEVDCGGGRTGAEMADFAPLVQFVESCPNLKLTGLYTFRGLNGGIDDPALAGAREGELLAQYRKTAEEICGASWRSAAARRPQANMWRSRGRRMKFARARMCSATI